MFGKVLQSDVEMSHDLVEEEKKTDLVRLMTSRYALKKFCLSPLLC